MIKNIIYKNKYIRNDIGYLSLTALKAHNGGVRNISSIRNTRKLIK